LNINKTDQIIGEATKVSKQVEESTNAPLQGQGDSNSLENGKEKDKEDWYHNICKFLFAGTAVSCGVYLVCFIMMVNAMA
jgi:hypothetical protein